MRRILRRFRWHLELGAVAAALVVVGILAWPRLSERIERDRVTYHRQASLAVYRNDFEALAAILDKYPLAWLEPPGRSLDTPLLYATAGQRNVSMIALLLDHGADVNALRDKWGGSALTAAIATQDPQYRPDKAAETVAFLLDHGADPNRGAALTAAVQYGEHDALRVLLEHGADPSLRGDAGQSARDRAQSINCAICLALFEEAAAGRVVTAAANP
jgi:hypothetical protein